ncbi:MAG: hypothetical protein OXC02_03200 [Rhodobacteraceae bacterium]|nr:hypothetical protein [Paracoccaceae bacterium]
MFSPDFIFFATLLGILIFLPWVIIFALFALFGWFYFCGIDLCLEPDLFDVWFLIIEPQLQLSIV